MKILYISYDGMTDALGQSQVIPYLLGLTAKGHEIFLISCEKKHPESKEYTDVYCLFRQKNIKWFPLKYSATPPVLSTLFDLRDIISKANNIIKYQKIEAVHCRSYIAAIAGLKMKKKYGIKFIFDMRGFWADERIEGNIWNIRNPVFKIIYKYFKKKEKQLLINADYVICLTENAKNEIQNWRFVSNPLPIKVIPCCADLNLFNRNNINEEKKIALRKKLKLSETDFVLSYLGSIGTWYLLEEMLDFFKVLFNKNNNSKFLFITNEQPQKIIEAAKKKEIHPEKVIIRKALRDKVPELLSLSDVSIFFIKPVYSKKASSPTKMGEIMAMGIPVICNKGIGDADNILADTNAGLIIQNFNTEEYNKAVEYLDMIIKINPDKIRDVAIKYYSLDDGVEKYNYIYKDIERAKIS